MICDDFDIYTIFLYMVYDKYTCDFGDFSRTMPI